MPDNLWIVQIDTYRIGSIDLIPILAYAHYIRFLKPVGFLAYVPDLIDLDMLPLKDACMPIKLGFRMIEILLEDDFHWFPIPRSLRDLSGMIVYELSIRSQGVVLHEWYRRLDILPVILSAIHGRSYHDEVEGLDLTAVGLPIVQDLEPLDDLR